jgi:D-alanine-D-alanine ligase
LKTLGENKKLNVAVLFGGRSPEHNISILSAKNVIKALDKSKYNPILIGIDRNGHWLTSDDALTLLESESFKEITASAFGQKVLLSQNTNDKTLISLSQDDSSQTIDVIFPVLHGTYGEDGSIQGLAKLANIPCVGCGIIGSAVGLDKDIMKRILRDDGYQVAPSVTVRSNQKDSLDYQSIVDDLGNELFIKPVHLGSSVGVSFVKDEASFKKGIELAFKYDHKVLIEQKIVGRELECAILGNLDAESSTVGEIVTHSGWYSFESKYLDEEDSNLHIPASLSNELIEEIREIAVGAFTLLECRGLARVDVFLQQDNQIIINEVNTMPGFTNISMYPKLWEHAGVDNQSLISKLIQLAIQENDSMNHLQTSNLPN